MGHAVILRDFIGLLGTGDPRIGEKSSFSNFLKQGSNQKQKQFTIDQKVGR